MQFAFTSVERGSWSVRLGNSILGSGPRLPYLCDWPAHVYVHILLPLSSVGGNLPRNRPIRLIEERIIVGRNLAKAAIEVFQLMKLCKVIIGWGITLNGWNILGWLLHVKAFLAAIDELSAQPSLMVFSKCCRYQNIIELDRLRVRMMLYDAPLLREMPRAFKHLQTLVHPFVFVPERILPIDFIEQCWFCLPQRLDVVELL